MLENAFLCIWISDTKIILKKKSDSKKQMFKNSNIKKAV